MPWTRSHGRRDDISVLNSDELLPSSMGRSEQAERRTVEEQRARWERKRVRTAKELVETERRYVEQLDLVTTYFVEILRAKGTLRLDIRESIFGPIKSIYQANEVLLQSLERGEFGVGFEEFCLHLDLYRRYTDGLEQASKVLQSEVSRSPKMLPLDQLPCLVNEINELTQKSCPENCGGVFLLICTSVPRLEQIQVKKNKSFARFKRLQEGRPEFQGLKLEELLPLPLQRVLQYKHLLRDLTENTSPDTSEFQQLTRAVRAVSEVAQYIQDNARSHENYLQVVRVQKLLKGRKTKVLMPGRVYIREGWLTAVPQKGEEVKQKMFFLFSDILLMTKPCHPLHLLHADKFCCQSVFPLEECAVEKVFGHTRSQGGLINLSIDREKLLLMSTDQEDINDWFRCLSAAIGQLKARRTIIKRKEDLAREPQNAALASTSEETPGLSHLRERKRNLNEGPSRDKPAPHMVACQPAPGSEQGESAPKRVKLSEATGPAQRFQENSTPSAVSMQDRSGGVCVLL